MEGTKSDERRSLQIHREFECSRLECEVLADTYERVLPGNYVEFAERNEDGGELLNRSRHALGRGVQTPSSVVVAASAAAIGGLE